MHVTIKTTDFKAMDITKEYFNKNSIKYDIVIIADRCIMTVKSPSPDVLRTISRFGKTMSPMTDFNICVYVDKAVDPISIEDLDI